MKQQHKKKLNSARENLYNVLVPCSFFWLADHRAKQFSIDLMAVVLCVK